MHLRQQLLHLPPRVPLGIVGPGPVCPPLELPLAVDTDEELRPWGPDGAVLDPDGVRRAKKNQGKRQQKRGLWQER